MTAGHQEALVRAAADGDVWQLWYVSVADLVAERASAYMDAALQGQARGDMLPWVVRELGTNTIVGTTRYHDIVPAIDRVEIGFTFYAGAWQRTHVNTACKLLLLTHAFDTLGCKVVAFRVDNLNLPSQRAVETLGARLDGVLRHYQPRRDGSARDMHVYSILAPEWPDVRTRLLARLARHAS
jgi:RimJ/RimL family protein N-acetyltransferase